jgi:enoyl-CoA hydratase/carnithine racemase
LSQQTKAVSLEDHSNSLVIRFTRPEIRNPLSIEVIGELESILETRITTSIQKLVFTGTDDVFASGADLREIAMVTAESAREFSRRGQSLMNKIAGLPQQTVAAINGYCFGGALDLALACDRRIASPNAVFSHPGASLGIITGWGGTQRLPRLVGQARALEMLFTASRVSSSEALSIGLIDGIAADALNKSLNTSVSKTG